MHLPCSTRDMQSAHMQSPHFCDIYNATTYNKYPKGRKAIEKLQQAMLSLYVVQGGLLHIHMKNNFGEQEPILCVPPSKIDIFLDLYHTSLLGGHSGITKCYQTLKQRIYCPNLPYYVRLYIISCHICQLFKGSKKFDRRLMKRFYDISTSFLLEETRIKPGYIPTTRGNVSHLADLKKIIRSRFQLQGV